MLDLDHVIAGQAVHELAGHVTGLDGAELVDQDLALASLLMTEPADLMGKVRL